LNYKDIDTNRLTVFSTNDKNDYKYNNNLEIPLSSKLYDELITTSNFKQYQNPMTERSNFSEVFKQISDNNSNILNKNQFKFRNNNNLNIPGIMTQRSENVSSPAGYSSIKQD